MDGPIYVKDNLTLLANAAEDRLELRIEVKIK